MPHTETTLMLHSTKDGPWVAVKRLVKIVVRGATTNDILELRFKDHDLAYDPEPMRTRGNGVFHLNFPRGKVQVTRIAGSQAVTVFGHCKEYI